MTLAEFDEQFEEASRYFMLQEAGRFIDEHGLENFLNQVFPFVNNPVEENNISKYNKYK